MEPHQNLETKLSDAANRCHNHPEKIQYLFELVELLCMAGQLDMALSTLHTFTPIHGQHAGFHEWLGRIAFTKNELTQAIQHFKNALTKRFAATFST